MNAAQMVFSVALMWPLLKLWGALGIRALATIPLWRWLAPLGTAGIIIQWLIGVLIADFFIYWRHRAEHKWFWPIHAVHHAPTELHAANDIGHPAPGVDQRAVRLDSAEPDPVRRTGHACRDPVHGDAPFLLYPLPH